jgi:hypothetical protein
MPDMARGRLQQHLHVTCAVDDDVGFSGRVAELVQAEVSRAEPVRHLGLPALGDQVDNVGLVAALHRQPGVTSDPAIELVAAV